MFKHFTSFGSSKAETVSPALAAFPSRDIGPAPGLKARKSATGNAVDQHQSPPDTMEDDEMKAHIDQNSSALGSEAQNAQSCYQPRKQAPAAIFAICHAAPTVTRDTNKAYYTPQATYGAPTKTSTAPC
ncbi:hypothetical protein HPB48_002634 [Haemaphysalis longicornis]|uniref:Uncharacterized protein n=1 Tax=Haemaphysalis longicornis TaxID=44386 RepID=A0A9J6G3R4_HAELO|nr:hypothetical protein HPB48_002634 [Haemaphysalis longicornis]